MYLKDATHWSFLHVWEDQFDNLQEYVCEDFHSKNFTSFILYLYHYCSVWTTDYSGNVNTAACFPEWLL